MCLGFLAWFGFFLLSHSSRAVINMVNSYVVSNPRVKKSLAQSQLTDNLLTASERGRQHFWPETMALTERSLEQRTDSTRLVCPRSLHAWARKQREGAAATNCQAGPSPDVSYSWTQPPWVFWVALSCPEDQEEASQMLPARKTRADKKPSNPGSGRHAEQPVLVPAKGQHRPRDHKLARGLW